MIRSAGRRLRHSHRIHNGDDCPMTIAARSPKRGCMFCGTAAPHTFIDLGMSPLCESYVPEEKLNQMNRLSAHAFVCEKCFLVQLDEYVSREEIFTEYAYFPRMRQLGSAHEAVHGHDHRPSAPHEAKLRVEVASNDGYLLQHSSIAASRFSASSRRRTSPQCGEEGNPPPSSSSSGGRPPRNLQQRERRPI